MRDRFRLVGNAFHAGVLKHMMLACISTMAMRAKVITRNDPRRLGEQPFEENMDAVKAPASVAKSTRSAKKATAQREEEAWAGIKASLTGKIVKSSAAVSKHITDSWACITARLKGEQSPSSKAKVQRTQQPAQQTEKKTPTKKRVAMWRAYAEGQGVARMQQPATTLGEVIGERWTKGERAPQLKRMQWERQRAEDRLRPEKGAANVLKFGTELADDYAVKSKAQATWKSYSAWGEVYEAFAILFGVSLEGGAQSKQAWQMRVEVLRVSVALLSLDYALSTIQIYTSAVSYFFRMRGWESPWRAPTFAASLEGIKRELGQAKRKQPPIEAKHIAALFDMKQVPKGWSALQWKQARALILTGWQLFNRRQDFARLQPCDLRFSRVKKKRRMEVLIRYAKNDVRGVTRAPVLEEQSAAGEPCPIDTMEIYMKAADIKVAKGCDKIWGRPHPCRKCEPLFPSILGPKKGGKRPREMPDPRVSKIVKGAMVALATANPELLSMEEARKFSAKSMRCGGTSAAAAEQVRDGVLQGHGGWISRQSLISYDLMMESEKTLVSQELNSAVVYARKLHEEDEGSEQEDEPDEDCEEYEVAFEIEKILDQRTMRGERQFQVQWKPCKENAFSREERTWESEETLKHDGNSAMLRAWLRKKGSSTPRRKARKTGKLEV